MRKSWNRVINDFYILTFPGNKRHNSIYYLFIISLSASYCLIFSYGYLFTNGFLMLNDSSEAPVTIRR